MLRRALIIVAFLAGFSHLGWAASSNNEFLAHLVAISTGKANPSLASAANMALQIWPVIRVSR